MLDTPDPVRGLLRELPGWTAAGAREVATLSRLPIRSQRVHAMPGTADRAILETVVDVGGERLALLNVHFSTASRPRSLARSFLQDAASAPAYLRDTAAVRLAQAEVLLDIAGRAGTPLIIAGDFNTPPRGVLYRRVTRRLHDSFRDSGWGLGHTYRSDIPVLRIDYVLAGPGTHPVRCHVPRVRVSDRRATVADLVLVGPGGRAATPATRPAARATEARGRPAPE